MAPFVLSAYLNPKWICSLCLCRFIYQCQRDIANVNITVLTEGILVSPTEIHHKVRRDVSIAIVGSLQNGVLISDTVLWLVGNLSVEEGTNLLSEQCADVTELDERNTALFTNTFYPKHDAYFIWKLAFVTSRRYSAARMGKRLRGDYDNAVNMPIGSDNKGLSDKILALYRGTIITFFETYLNLNGLRVTFISKLQT